ncbi:ABC transporter substrate-binding protein [Agreia sp. COWG]|uniref:ABC transporter substrate-binding protein n=1 Tax=Agreia sp. COWG TaxID=2773266 RepID=UPI001925B847|nr:ABC transporter substrate-binding protein [Agreia sp. COWG]CAD5995105.1 Nitrate ABC transporter substrate-binding protein [Agreia sp. COWG]
MTSRHTRSALALGIIATTALGLTACSGGATTSGSTASSTQQIGSVDLAAAGCPATISVQTDWNPEAEHGSLYEMLDPSNVTVDTSAKTVTGPLMAGGEYTGVNLQVRAGGPAIGFQTVPSQMYSDDSITLGYVYSDEAVQNSVAQPTVGVFAPLDKTPTMIMWDPATYPDVKTIADLGKTDAFVRYFGGSAYMEYLISSGLLKKSQTDGGYDGTPANFVAAGGKDAQQGYASAEPYIYENEVSSWMKPVKYQLINDAGWEIYPVVVSARSGDMDKLAPCLKALVPVMQKADVDYYADPAKANGLILDLVDKYDTGWVYSQGVADYSVKTQKDLGLVGNGSDTVVGNFDMDRLQKFVDLATPIYKGIGSVPTEGLSAKDIATNEFIDPSIGFPQ